MEKRLHGVYLREKFPSPCLFYFVPLRSPLRLLNPKNGRRRNTLWIYYYKTVRFEYLSYNHFRILLFFVQVLAPLPDFIAKNMSYYCNGGND